MVEKDPNEKIIAEITDNIKNLENILLVYNTLKSVLPDINMKWDRNEKMGYYSNSVDKVYDEIAIDSASGHCGSANYYARSIKIVNGIRVRGTLIYIGHRYFGDMWSEGSGIKPEDNWKEEVSKLWKDDAIKKIQAYLDNDPPVLDHDIFADNDEENEE